MQVVRKVVLKHSQVVLEVIRVPVWYLALDHQAKSPQPTSSTSPSVVGSSSRQSESASGTGSKSVSRVSPSVSGTQSAIPASASHSGTSSRSTTGSSSTSPLVISVPKSAQSVRFVMDVSCSQECGDDDWLRLNHQIAEYLAIPLESVEIDTVETVVTISVTICANSNQIQMDGCFSRWRNRYRIWVSYFSVLSSRRGSTGTLVRVAQ